MIRQVLTAAAIAALGGAVFAAELKSGPQAGEKVPGPFHPLNINGDAAGKKNCLYCEAGDSPTVAVFARNANDPALKKLIAALDDATVKNTKAEMYSFVVFCSSDAKLQDQLKDLAGTSKLKKLVLALDTEDGPEKYNIHKDAETTVLLYKDRVVTANHTYAKGAFSDTDVAAILGEVATLVK